MAHRCCAPANPNIVAGWRLAQGASSAKTLVPAFAHRETAMQELPTELAIVITLPVEYDREFAGFIGDRLVAPGQIDNTEPAHPDPDVAGKQDPLVVGTAMPNGVAHDAKQSMWDFILPVAA